MPWASRWMTGFGVISLVCAALGWATADAGVRSGLAVGLAMIAAGAAAAQGRRSLRKTGGFVGIFLPVLAAAFWGWRAWDQFTNLTNQPRLLPAILLSVMSLAGLLTVVAVVILRGGDNIAERGYSVGPVTPGFSQKQEPQQQPQHGAEHK